MTQGIFSPVPYKNSGDLKLTNREIFSETKTLSATTQTGATYEIPNKGDLAGFVIEISASATGTLTGASKLAAAVKSLSILDKSGNPIIQDISGSDVQQRLGFWLGNKGIYPTLTDVSGTAATDSVLIQISVDSSDLPAKVQITYAPFSDMATSGATGGNATVALTPIYRNGHTGTTDRVRKLVLSVASGSNALASYLPRGKILYKMGMRYTATYLTDVQFSRDGSEELKMTENKFKAYERELFNSGHQAGLVFLDMTPAIITDLMVLNWTTSTADTLSLYLIYRDVVGQ